MPKVLKLRKVAETPTDDALPTDPAPTPEPDPRPEVNHPLYRRYSLGIFGKPNG
jgi:hypothetical protein